jgi:hypothetical protein
VKHGAILELLVKHSFYADGRCPDFAIEPSVETARLLRNHRCLVGATPGGLRVLTALDAGTGQPFLPLPTGTVLRFHLEQQNTDFSLFTDLGDLTSVSVDGQPRPLFTNAGLAPGAAGELLLVAGDSARARGIFADVDIHLDGQSPGPQPAAFHVAFQAKQWRWAYYCVTDLPTSGDDLTIVDTAPNPNGTVDVLLFSAANRTKLDEQPDIADPIAVQIAGRYPGMRCVRMLSDQAVTCHEEPRKHLELWHGTDRLSGPLPNPSVRCVSRMSAEQPPQDLLFQIVKYRANPFA